MPVPYSSVAIANSFIEKFGGEAGIEHMKLQKLVYCSYGWWLSMKGIDQCPLTDEGPEIWRHGPVFSRLYRVFRIFGRQGIADMQSDNPFSEPNHVGPDDKEVLTLIAWIWRRYGHLSSLALSDMTHKPGTPWHRMATENNFRIALNTTIPNRYIYEDFQKLFQPPELVHTNESDAQNARQQHA